MSFVHLKQTHNYMLQTRNNYCLLLFETQVVDITVRPVHGACAAGQPKLHSGVTIVSTMHCRPSLADAGLSGSGSRTCESRTLVLLEVSLERLIQKKSASTIIRPPSVMKLPCMSPLSRVHGRHAVSARIPLPAETA